MDDMSGILARDFGIRPQGKAAPMAASKTAPSNRSTTSSSSAWTSSASPSYDDFFNPTAPSAAAAKSRSTGSQPHDPILDTFSKGPVFDTPVYDDDIFDGVPGVRSSGNMRFDDVFGSGTSDRSRVESPPAYDDLLGSLGSSSGRVDRSHAASPPPYDDFLGGLGAAERKGEKDKGSVKTKSAADLSGFDDLLPGFGSAVPPQPKRETRESDLPKPQNPAPSVQDDPFSVFETVTSTPSVPPSGLFSDPLDEFTTAGPTVVDSSTATDSLFSENHNSFESGSSNNGREKNTDLNGSFREKNNPKLSARDTSPMGSFHKKGLNESSPLDDFDMPSGRTGHRSMGSDSFSRNKMLGKDPSPESSENSETGEYVWLTVSEIPLFTRPTSAPPPSRPPPPLTVKHKSRQNHSFNKDSSPVDDLEDFAMGNTYPQKFEFDEGEMERSSAAMKDAMNKAEAKFRHAKEVREKMKGKEAEHQDTEDAEREIAEKEREQREKEDRERERRRIEREEEEKRRKERDMARMAVERATREARERAANEARLRAERAAVLRAQQEARERAAAEARERAMFEAKEKAEREAREKAAAEAAAERERVQREAREKAAAERLEKERAEKEMQRRNRAAVERASAEARERAARAAKEKYQQQSQAPQRKPDPVPQSRSDPDDLESFFGSRANSAPRPERSPASADPLFETQTQTRVPSDTSRRTASASGPSIPKAASVNMMDDLSAIFGAPSSSSGGEFQEIDGEPEERRNARWRREQAAKDRATKALQEKNERDLQAQREQAERHRIGESLDFEIRRWSAGKEGNLRALLSSLHYILWQESGWQPVSMADLINGQNVKKVYRKATLCVHPDKVQQKGATLQQKYIAEKVFDLLKEAWNKFNSEELF